MIMEEANGLKVYRNPRTQIRTNALRIGVWLRNWGGRESARLAKALELLWGSRANFEKIESLLINAISCSFEVGFYTWSK